MKKYDFFRIFIVITILISQVSLSYSQVITSEKATFRLNVQTAARDMTPAIQMLQPENIKEGETFMAPRQQITLAMRLVNGESGMKLLVNNIEVAPTAAGDVFLRDVSLNTGSNLVTIVLQKDDKPVKEYVYNMVYVEQVKNISPRALNPGKYYALIVANGTYGSAELQSLKRTIPDAKALKEILQTKYTFDPENVYTLYDMKRDNLIMALDDIQKKLTAEDNLLIFYAGHGKMDEESGIGYWLLSDASMSSRINWFSNSSLTDYIKSIKAKHIFLVADACYAGSIFYSRGAMDAAPPSIADIYKNKSRTAMTSGGTTEVNDDSKFSEILIEMLRSNTDQFLTSGQLFRAIERPVMTSGSNTAPRFGVIQGVNDMQGDFVFILREK